MWLLDFKVSPKPGTEYAKEFGGAVIVYLVNIHSKTDADRIARKHLEEDGWIITETQEIRKITRDICSNKLLPTFEKAEKYGDAYIALTYPK